MANIVFTNNASALLAASITSGGTTIQVAAGYGDLFPVITAPQYCYATLEDNAGNIEIVKVTARALLSDLLTVERGQEGTVGQAFTLSITRVELRMTKATLEEFLQINGGTLTGDLDLNTNNLIDAHINGVGTRFTQGQIAGVPLRGAVDATGNEIAVNADGVTRATAGGAAILATGDDIMAELDTAGVILFDSATVGLQVPAGAYLRVEGPTAANHGIMSHDDTNFIFSFLNTTAVTWDTLLEMSADINMQDNQIIRPVFIDFAIKKQAVSSTVALDIDYELGSYVVLTMTSNITALDIINFPTTDVATVRIKVVQAGAGSFTIAGYPTGINWARGVVPTLSTAPGEYDFIDLWTDDGGATWNGSFDVDWN